MTPSAWWPFLAELADRADEIALGRFRAQDLRVDEKPNEGPVSEADLAIEELARRLTAERYPQLGVMGEEHGEREGSSATRLIIDPIDATQNFVRGIPIFATLLAIEDEGTVVASMISAPALGSRWNAAKGAGAFCGGRRLQVSGISRLDRAQIFHGSLGGAEGQKTPATLVDLLRRSHRQRGFGDFYQHCLVAEGCGEIALDPIVHAWDIAPLILLVEEAGGRATSLAGTRSIYEGSLLSTNGRLHDEALRVLAG